MERNFEDIVNFTPETTRRKSKGYPSNLIDRIEQYNRRILPSRCTLLLCRKRSFQEILSDPKFFVQRPDRCLSVFMSNHKQYASHLNKSPCNPHPISDAQPSPSGYDAFFKSLLDLCYDSEHDVWKVERLRSAKNSLQVEVKQSFESGGPGLDITVGRSSSREAFSSKALTITQDRVQSFCDVDRVREIVHELLTETLYCSSPDLSFNNVPVRLYYVVDTWKNTAPYAAFGSGRVRAKQDRGLKRHIDMLETGESSSLTRESESAGETETPPSAQESESDERDYFRKKPRTAERGIGLGRAGLF